MAIYIDNKKVSPIVAIEVEKEKPKQSKSVIPTTSQQVVEADTGYELSEVLVTGVTSDIDVNIVPDNIVKDVTILGVTGVFEGSKTKPEQEKNVTPSIDLQIIEPDEGYTLSKVTISGVTSNIDSNIKSENIAKDITILGVTGTFDGGITPSGTLEITNNGTYDVTNYANANVSVSGSLSSGDRLQWKCDNVKSLFYEFYGYTGDNLYDVLNGLDTINVKNMSYMFNSCKNVISIPQLDTSSVTDMSYMFNNCYKLSVIPRLNTEKVVNMSSMFRNCQDIITIPALDTRKVVDMNKMFSAANNLKTIEGIYMDSVTRNTDFLYSNSKLETLNLYNIKLSLTIGSGTSWGHLLSVDSLVGCCKECVQQSSAKTLTVGTANLEKLANVYVKLLEDDGSGKLPCEVCESTDEGAMLISEYMTLKNWQLA